MFTHSRYRYSCQRPRSGIHLTGTEHIDQRSFFRRGDCEIIHGLDLNPHLGIRAVVRIQGRLPRLWPLISLRFIDVIGYCQKLRMS